MPSGAELFARTLIHLGIDRIFTLVGDHLNEVLTVSSRAGIRIIDMRHESGVTHAADAWARITRKPAVSLVTGGPGHTNSLTGIATAQLAASPLIAISGSRATAVADRQAFQDIDQVGMARPVSKWASEPPNAAQIPFYLGRAYAEANAGRRGAVHLTIPVDLFTSSTEAPAPMPQIPRSTASGPAQQQIDEAIRLIGNAERPVVIAGSGVWWADAGVELASFVEKANLPLYTITMARGVVSDEHPLCFGYADPALNGAVQKVFQEADLVLVLGKRIDYRLALGGARLFPSAVKFIQVDVHPQELGMNRALDVGICADVKLTLDALIDALPKQPKDRSTWIGHLHELRTAWQQQLAARALETSDLLHPAAFFTELKKWLPRETLFAWDGGDFIHWGRAILPAIHAAGWLRLGPLGTIGSALPNSLSLKLAKPDNPVVMITGDGSLGFYIAELDTAVRYNLPVVIIVGNDGGWGLERELQAATTGPDIVACELRRTRYDAVMQGFGGGGETINELQEVGPAMQRALSSGVPYCLNVNIRGVRSPFTEWQIKGKKKQKTAGTMKSTLFFLAVPLLASTVNIYVANSDGDNVTIIDPVTNSVKGEIKVSKNPHGIVVSPDRKRFYVSSESEDVLDTVDAATLKVIHRTPLGRRPNNLAITQDGRRVYVCIRGQSWVDIVDTASLDKVKSVPVGRGPHNVYLTPNGQYMIATSMDDHKLTAIDVKTEEPAFEIPLPGVPRPVFIDHAMKNLYVQLSNLHGFVVVDYAKRQVIKKVLLPDGPAGAKPLIPETFSHGIGITPDGKTLWVNSLLDNSVSVFSVPDLKRLATIPVGRGPDWLTFTPDSKKCFISNAGSNSVSAMDVASLTEITKIPVGKIPKRIITVVFP